MNNKQGSNPEKEIKSQVSKVDTNKVNDDRNNTPISPNFRSSEKKYMLKHNDKASIPGYGRQADADSVSEEQNTNFVLLTFFYTATKKHFL